MQEWYDVRCGRGLESHGGRTTHSRGRCRSGQAVACSSGVTTGDSTIVRVRSWLVVGLRTHSEPGERGGEQCPDVAPLRAARLSAFEIAISLLITSAED
jgi:hypothetical protein